MLEQMTDQSAGGSPGGPDRRAPRRRVLLTAVVAYPDLSISYRCAIRDRSDSGARLKLPDGLVVPPQFWMIDVASGLAYEATTVWRRYPEVGVALASPLDLKPDVLPAGPQRRLRALWAEAAPRR